MTLTQTLEVARRCVVKPGRKPVDTRSAVLSAKLHELPERRVLAEELEAGAVELLYFAPYKGFYGGLMVYWLKQNRRLYRQYLGNSQARELGLVFGPTI